ncbi:MAG: hypothetical protein KF761_09885 [Salinibacterium sp.]|nr:hypothetical protein [Salinibacterium sp.]
MALLTSTTEAPAMRPPRHLAATSRGRSQIDPYPRRRGIRWLVRALYSLPFLVATALVYGVGTPIDGTPNAALVERVSLIDWTRADVVWLGEIYPPITTLIAALTPGGRLGLAVLGSLVAGVFLQKLGEIMVQRRFHRSTSNILMIALAANPLFFYTATENFAGFVGLIFFGLGIADIVRFVTWGNTQSGFRAGIFFALSTLSDTSGLLYVLTALAAVPFLVLKRRGQAGARASVLLVVAYPTLAAIGALMLLNLVFLHNPLGEVGVGMLDGADGRLAGLPALFASLTGWLLLAPVVSAWLSGVIVGRWKAIPVASLVFVAILVAFVAGLIAPGSAGNTFIMMTVLAIALIPAAKQRGTTALLNVVAVAQVAIAWLAAFDRPIVVEWMSALWSALGLG